MRNELLDLTIILPATAYHQGNYVETYSRYSQVAVSTLESLSKKQARQGAKADR